ncbi:MAG: hypothetical protein IKO99_09355 [Bacteroidales bacterium]|jgi:hypothetical protein|nr:hypothetical protein [Bacteroidales bacterium]MBR4678195.1 hypothetical protein [Bacteroidales bacterium]
MAAAAAKLEISFLQQILDIAQDKSLFAELKQFVKKLLAKKHDETLMTKEEFLAEIAEARAQAERGEVKTFTDKQEMMNWLNSL